MYKMTTKSGEEILVASFDGGGCFVESYDYDVAYMVADGGGYDEVKQADIASVIDEETGEPYTELGNRYFPGHPYKEN